MNVPGFLPPTQPSTLPAERTYLEQLGQLRAEQEREGLVDGLAGATPTSAFGPLRDTVSISTAAKQARQAEQQKSEQGSADTSEPGEEELSDGEQEMVRELESRDREIRQHEQAHKAAAGNLAVGGPSYTYQTGPDGKRYAIGGEVKIRLKTGRTPEETLRNMEQAQRAANAPQSPSGPDRAVAGQAARIAGEARRELQQEGGQGANAQIANGQKNGAGRRGIDLLA